MKDRDIENFLVAATPGGIERQEKAGQIEQTFLETLPKDCNRELFEKAGFVFKADADDLFVNVEFPKGWRKKPTEHSMWSDIVDEKGRTRGKIFYKAAFYDRSAHAHLELRFSVGEDWGSSVKSVFITDAAGQVNERIGGLKAPDWEDREQALSDQAALDQARETLRAWLSKHYPKWGSPLEYWD